MWRMRSLNSLNFFWRFIVLRARFGILWVRGGLGNQLFQISALSFFSKQLNFSPIIHPHNLRQARDEFTPQYRNLGVQGLFNLKKQNNNLSPDLEFILRCVYRVYSKYASFAIYTESKLLNSSEYSMPRLFFIQDYFQSREYPDHLSNDSLNKLVRSLPISNSHANSEYNCPGRVSAMLHLRLTDSHFKNNNRSRLLSLEAIMRKNQIVEKISKLDVYSDDLPLAKELLKGFFISTLINYPEEFEKFSSSTLLEKFMQYECIVASNSTLSWWACYLRSRLYDNQSIVLADFDPKLMRHGWISAST